MQIQTNYDLRLPFMPFKANMVVKPSISPARLLENFYQQQRVFIKNEDTKTLVFN